MNELTSILGTAKEILQNEGPISLVKRTFFWLLHFVYWHDIYALHMMKIESNLNLDESEFKPEIENLTMKVITSNQDADELEAEGFEFRSYPTKWNYDLEMNRKRLDQGVLTFCTFVGYELAAIQWVLPSQQAHDRMGTWPQKVDYANGEASSRGAWVNPKYRQLGLFRHAAYFHRDPYLIERGITVLRAASSQYNKAGPKLAMGIGFTDYAKAHYVKVLWWKFWKEVPFDTDQSM